MIRIILALLSASFVLAGCWPVSAPAGADGIGDGYYPQLGNGGYDAQRYELDLAVDPVNNSLTGSCTLTAQATQDLGAFNLDFSKLEVEQVTVNARQARFQRNERELTITPARVIQAGDTFTTTVFYHGSPQPVLTVGMLSKTGWFHTEDNQVFVTSEISGAASWYPVNDHPIDKASYQIRITVPNPYTVVAIGLLKQVLDNGDTVTYTWEASEPVASYVVGLSVAEYRLETEPGPAGVLIRNYLPPDFSNELRAGIDQTGAMIAFFSERFGPYPFPAYGTVIVGIPDFGAMETQMLSQHAQVPALLDESVIAHELAHQWFGDSVSLVRWQDLWLKEGAATYAAQLWEEHKAGPEAMLEWAQSAYRFENWSSNPPGEPLPSNLYTGTIYNRGALIFHALRLRVGDKAFFQILRTYTGRFQYANASAQDFIGIAEEVSGQELGEFFDAWLHDKKIPPIPELGLAP